MMCIWQSIKMCHELWNTTKKTILQTIIIIINKYAQSLFLYLLGSAYWQSDTRTLSSRRFALQVLIEIKWSWSRCFFFFSVYRLNFCCFARFFIVDGNIHTACIAFWHSSWTSTFTIPIFILISIHFHGNWLKIESSLSHLSVLRIETLFVCHFLRRKFLLETLLLDEFATVRCDLIESPRIFGIGNVLLLKI